MICSSSCFGGGGGGGESLLVSQSLEERGLMEGTEGLVELVLVFTGFMGFNGRREIGGRGGAATVSGEGLREDRRRKGGDFGVGASVARERGCVENGDAEMEKKSIEKDYLMLSDAVM
jgi:hypothetical protein